MKNYLPLPYIWLLLACVPVLVFANIYISERNTFTGYMQAGYNQLKYTNNWLLHPYQYQLQQQITPTRISTGRGYILKYQVSRNTIIIKDF